MFPAALFRTCPVLALAALAGFALVVYGAIRRRTFAGASLPLGLALISFLMLLIQVITGRYNFRYTAPAYGSICMLGGIGLTASLQPLYKLLVPLGRPAAAGILGFALAVTALRDLNFARDKFLSTGMQDLSLRFVLDVPPAPIPARDSPHNSR
jgi:hypothetical protein